MAFSTLTVKAIGAGADVSSGVDLDYEPYTVHTATATGSTVVVLPDGAKIVTVRAIGVGADVSSPVERAYVSSRSATSTASTSVKGAVTAEAVGSVTIRVANLYTLDIRAVGRGADISSPVQVQYVPHTGATSTASVRIVPGLGVEAVNPASSTVVAWPIAVTGTAWPPGCTVYLRINPAGPTYTTTSDLSTGAFTFSVPRS